jgi:MFS family permease
MGYQWGVQSSAPLPAKKRGVIAVYIDHLSSFHPNARLYLLSSVLTAAAFGVYRLLFNFYVLSSGYDEALLGNLITVNSLTALLVALPMGYLADNLGRKYSLLLSGGLTAVSVLVIVLFPSAGMFIAMSVLLGAAQSLGGVTSGPFLMENSSEKERTYLFSFSMGLQMIAASVGNWIGGYLPGWIGSATATTSTSVTAYGGSLVVIAAFAALSTAHTPRQR